MCKLKNIIEKMMSILGWVIVIFMTFNTSFLGWIPHFSGMSIADFATKVVMVSAALAVWCDCRFGNLFAGDDR
jgi:hypothetical protein